MRDEARLRERPHPDVEALQVHEHADDDVAACGGLEERTIECGFVADVLAEQLPAIHLREQRSSVKRVDDQRTVRIPCEVHGVRAAAAEEEVSRKVDTGDGEAGAASHL